MKPASAGSFVNIICSSSYYSAIHLGDIHELDITGINISHCGRTIRNKVWASLYVSSILKFTMSDVVISHSKGYGMYAEYTQESNLKLI